MTIALRAAAAFLALVIAACASSPVALVALPSPPTSPRGGDHSASITVRLGEVRLPGYLESFPVVIGRTGNALILAENTEWAERLSEGVARVLRDALSQRLGPSRVLIAGERRASDADLAVEFLALDPREGVLELDARWFLSCNVVGSGRGARARLQVALDGATPPAVAAATSEALARFADVLAAELTCERSG